MNKYRWPEPDPRRVVAEMKEDACSLHWEECNNLVSKLVGRSNTPEDLKEEVVQEAMISIHKGLAGFRFESKLTTWLTRVVNSRRVDVLRRRYRQIFYLETSLDELQSASDNGELFEIIMSRTTEDECILCEDLRIAINELKKIFEQCSEQDKKILIKHFQDEEKYSQIAKDLGLKSEIVRYVCNRTRQALHEACQRPPF